MTLDRNPLTELEDPPTGANMQTCGRYWTVAQTHPQAENWAKINLLRAGYDAYLPTIITQRRDPHIRTLLHRVTKPLFTGYLFLHLGDTDPWTPIRYSPGILRLLMGGSKPTHLDTAILSAVQAGEAMRGMPSPDSLVLRPGAPVKCLQGPLRGREGVVIAASIATARIAMPMFNSIREIVVPINNLAPRD